MAMWAAQLIVEASNADEIWWESQLVNIPPWTYEDYLTVHNAAVGYAGGHGPNIIRLGQGQDPDPDYGNYFLVGRAGLVFDISDPALIGATITSATLSLYGLTDESVIDFDMTLVSGADLSDVFVDANYGDLLNAITSYGSLNTSGFLVEGWNVITLNAAGIAVLQVALASGVIRFGIRSSRDIASTEPPPYPPDWETVDLYDHTVTNKKPKLTINYQAFGGGGVVQAMGILLNN